MMATIKCSLPDELIAKLTRLGNKTDEMCERALTAGAEIIKESLATSLTEVVGKNTKTESRSTGELEESLGVSPVSIDSKGNYNLKIGFNEPRRKQSRAAGKRSYNTATNAMVANVLEYGKSGQAPKPFLKRAKSASRKAATEKISEVLESEMNSI